MAEVILQLSKYGSSFSTRERAKELTSEIERKPEVRNADIVIDFESVVVVSYSFADQLAGDLLALLTSGNVASLTFRKCDELVRRVLDHVVERRLTIEAGGRAVAQATRKEDTISLVASAA